MSTGPYFVKSEILKKAVFKSDAWTKKTNLAKIYEFKKGDAKFNSEGIYEASGTGAKYNGESLINALNEFDLAVLMYQIHESQYDSTISRFFNYVLSAKFSTSRANLSIAMARYILQ